MLLTADLGATNARFALLEGDQIQARTQLWTADFDTSTDLLAAGLQSLERPKLTGACLAAAGPLVDGAIHMTNAGLAFSEAALAAELRVPTRLLNDFEALAWALPKLYDTVAIGRPLSPLPGVRVVIGPGSGFGVAACVPGGKKDGGAWQPLRSEAGHADLAAGTPLENEVRAVLATQHSQVCWETVLSGPGLVRLYTAMAVIWGQEPAWDDPAEIVRLGLEAEDPLCHQTLETFASFLGAAASAMALTFYAAGGVFIAGGILPRLAGFLQSSPFRRRFEDNDTYGHWLAGLPTRLIVQPDAALLGCASAWSSAGLSSGASAGSTGSTGSAAS